MAQQMNLKPFYAALVVLAAIGSGAIWISRGGGGETVEVGPVPVSVSDFAGHVLGSDSAPVEIIEYADFGCGACAIFNILTGPDIKSRLIASGRVRLRFRDFMIPSHPNSIDAHMAAACAGEQGQFWPVADSLFFNQQAWMRDRRPERTFRRYAQSTGIDMGRFDDCVDSRRLQGRLEASKQEGLTLGVNATPSFVIGGLLVSSSLPYDSIVSLVERAEGAPRQ